MINFQRARPAAWRPPDTSTAGGAHRAEQGSGPPGIQRRRSRKTLGDLLPDWPELPVAGAVFAGLIIYGLIQRRRNGGESASRPENLATREGASWGRGVGAVLAEILGVIGIFAFGWPWWTGAAPAARSVLGVFLLRSIRNAERRATC